MGTRLVSWRGARRASTRGFAALLATVAIFQWRPAQGAPGDIFTSAAPVAGSDPPKATDLKDGDASVSTQTGALQYSYPIQVPPGRNGMAPQLALSYSSQAPIYGGVAVGWSLSVPEIREDHAQGRLRTRAPEVEQQQVGLDYKGDDRFVQLARRREPARAGDGAEAGGRLSDLSRQARRLVRAIPPHARRPAVSLACPDDGRHRDEVR